MKSPKKKYRITVQDFIKANRKPSLDEEIAAHGKQISFRKTLQKSKKSYGLKRMDKINTED